MIDSARPLLLLLSCFAGLATADSLPPSLVWTGDPYSSPSGGILGADANPTDTGMMVYGYCFEEGPSCGGQFFWYRPFTITSPGTFVFSAAVTDELFATNCLQGCAPSASVFAMFTVSDQLTDTGLSDSGSASNPGTCDPILGCQVTLNLSDSESSLITLGDGNYALYETYNGYADASGEVSLDFQGEFSLVPTPEPKTNIGIATALAMMLLLKARSGIRMLTHGGSE